VYLDGEKQFAFDVGKDKLTVPWDRPHTIEFRGNCCEPEQFEVGPGLPQPPGDRLVKVLTVKLGTLRVLAAPARTDTHIIVTEVPESPAGLRAQLTPGEELPIPFDAKGELRKTLEVSVYVEGRALPVKKTVEIKPGQKKILEVPLD
jgi:hypothetical protein